MHEVFQQLLPARRMDDFGVKLQPVEPALTVLDGGIRRVLCVRHGFEALGQLGHFVAVRIPNIHRCAQPFEERAILRHVQLRRAVFAPLAVLHFPAEKVRHELHAVADAEDRQAHGEDRLIRVRRFLRVNGRRPAAEDDSLWLMRGDFFRGGVVRKDDRIDVTLANPPRDDLRILTAEIENDDA